MMLLKKVMIWNYQMKPWCNLLSLVSCPNLLNLQDSISAPISSHFQHDDDQCKQFEDKSEHSPFPLDHQQQLQHHTITPAKLQQLAMSLLRKFQG